MLKDTDLLVNVETTLELKLVFMLPAQVRRFILVAAPWDNFEFLFGDPHWRVGSGVGVGILKAN